MTREALADRIITYCDALAAFSLVNALAFMIALAEPETRCSIARIVGLVVAMNLAFPVFITAALLALRRFELSLRRADPQDPTVREFWRYAHVLRVVLVWTFALLVVLGLFGASRDLSCAGAP